MNSDNIYFNNKCPARMNDSRIFTNYMPNKKTLDYINKINCLTDHNSTRYFLQSNAETIINNELNFFMNEKKCNFDYFENSFPKYNPYNDEKKWKEECKSTKDNSNNNLDNVNDFDSNMNVMAEVDNISES